MKLGIPYKLLIEWELDRKNILDSMNKQSGEQIFKFSYHPVSCELLFGAEPESHKEMIVEHGIHRFESYVRGIYFRERKVVYLRGHDDNDYLEKTRDMLREYGLSDDVRVIWGEKAAKELAEELRGL